jgi:hypothetical protein
MLWQSSLKPLKKAGLMVIFGGGLLVVAFAVLRCAMIFLVRRCSSPFRLGLFLFFSIHLPISLLAANPQFQDPVNGAQLAGSWAVRETFVAVVTTNLPMIFPAFKIWLAPLITSLRSTMRSSQKLSGNLESSRSRDLRTFGAGSSKGRREPPTLYNITAVTAIVNESEEHMVEMQDVKGSDSDDDTQGGRKHSIRQHTEVSVVREEVDMDNPPKAPRLW